MTKHGEHQGNNGKPARHARHAEGAWREHRNPEHKSVSIRIEGINFGRGEHRTCTNREGRRSRQGNSGNRDSWQDGKKALGQDTRCDWIFRNMVSQVYRRMVTDSMNGYSIAARARSVGEPMASIAIAIKRAVSFRRKTEQRTLRLNAR